MAFDLRPKLTCHLIGVKGCVRVCVVGGGVEKDRGSTFKRRQKESRQQQPVRNIFPEQHLK